MSRCLYLEYGSACDCGPCREGARGRRLQCPDPGHQARIATLEARVAAADRLADWIEGRVEEDHPEACAGRLCICQALAAYRASGEVTSGLA